MELRRVAELRWPVRPRDVEAIRNGPELVVESLRAIDELGLH